jgi:antitoxin StbD
VSQLDRIEADRSVAIGELRRRPAAVIKASGPDPIVVIDDNRPVAYLVSAASWAALMSRLDHVPEDPSATSS